MPPTVSVLLPTYDRAYYLEGSVRSVLDQEYADLELIVIDDGSTDGTAALLAGIDDPRLRVLRRSHAGISAALNAGLGTARGRYIARNDSDDLWHPALLATLLPVLERAPHLGFAYACSALVDADGAPKSETRGMPPRHPADGFRSLLYSDCSVAVTTIYRRRCLDEVGGWDPASDVAEDWDLALRVARHHPFRFVDRILAMIREHPGNATHLRAAGFEHRLAARRGVLDKVFAATDLPPAARRMRPLAYRNLHVGEAMQWLARGDRGQAVAAFRRALGSGGSRWATAGRIAWTTTLWFGVARHTGARRHVNALARRMRRVPADASPALLGATQERRG
jgi:GT2 family glycosyltransferase